MGGQTDYFKNYFWSPRCQWIKKKKGFEMEFFQKKEHKKKGWGER